jgi:DNA-binding NtrC family response regulator
MTDELWANQPVVLVVDDDEDVRDTTAHLLAMRGFRVLVASSKDEAMAVVRAHPGRVDACVADLSLPGDTRGDLARSLVEAFPRMRIIYATGIPRHIALTTGIVNPDTPYLEKPVDPDVLASMLRTVLPRPGAASNM